MRAAWPPGPLLGERESVASEPTVYVVDDDQAVRDSLRWLIESTSLSVETFASAREFLDAYDSERPGCLLLDVRMPGMSGLELQEKLNADEISLPVIIITGHGDVQMAVRAMKAGAVDFVEKPFNDQMLVESIRQAIDQDRKARRTRAETTQIKRRLSRLTPREHEVLGMVVAGKLTKQIAGDLRLSEKTIEVHRAHIMSKMHADNVADLVRMTLTARSST
ncbi:MAG: response regulator transcription factor [Phycisphaerae bacterium]|nr:response regulator transcription factor [Phycisphaerae bacterium]